jgi:hypothetical protein
MLFDTKVLVLLLTVSPCVAVLRTSNRIFNHHHDSVPVSWIQRGSIGNIGSVTLSRKHFVTINRGSHEENNDNGKKRNLSNGVITRADRKHPGTIQWKGKENEEHGNRRLGKLTRLRPIATSRRILEYKRSVRH